jgi:AmmeMemoRadiSam system protein B
MIRKAAFAYDWYPGDPKVLRTTIRSYLGEGKGTEKALGVVSPHAGYVYSGHVAGAVYSRIRIPDVVVVLSVNHRGVGERAAIMCSGAWEMPMGKVLIQEELARVITGNSTLLMDDTTAHTREHSLELQLPFLQYLNPGFELVPIALQHLSFDECEEMGNSLAAGIRSFNREVMIVASNDMSHFESQETAERKDQLAISKILELDPGGLYTTVKRHKISMCGVVPATVMLCACKKLGAGEARLVRYATSGDVSKDFSSVVGYAGIVIQ